MGDSEILLSGSDCLYSSFTWCTLFFFFFLAYKQFQSLYFFSLLISVTYSNKSRWVCDDSVCLMYVLLLWNGSLIAVFLCSNCEWAVWISADLNERVLHSRARSNMSRNTFFSNCSVFLRFLMFLRILRLFQEWLQRPFKPAVISTWWK